MRQTPRVADQRAVTLGITTAEPNGAAPTRERNRKCHAPSEKPIIPASANGFVRALALLDAEIRYNVRGAKYEICFNYSFNGPPIWEEANPRRWAYLFEKIAERCYFPGNSNKPARFGATLRKQVIDAYGFQREVDPFEGWLSSLPEWDGVPRLDTLLDSVFEVHEGQDQDLVAWISGAVLTTAVWRCKEPGYKQDVVPVLIGGQGIGKSTFLRSLLPDARDEWFGDGMSFSSDDKARVEATQGRVIVEISEMTGATRADVEQIKAYISRRDDGVVRLSYRRDPEAMPRRFALAGTTNDRSCLPSDPSGLRRFAPVDLDAKIIDGKRRTARFVHHWIARNRIQLWAEARARYEAEIPPIMPFELEIGAATEQAERYRNADEVVEEKLRNWLWVQRESFPLKAAVEAAGFKSEAPPTSAEGKRVARALQQLGCEKAKIHDARLWRPPPPTAD